jgi:hypothetical protein
LPEVEDLFSGWEEFPPTNLLVKAIVEGLGGGHKTTAEGDFTVPPEALDAMQRSALSQISVKAGPQLPIVRGRDVGLPSAAPVFDLDTMRQRNQDRLKSRVLNTETPD